MEKITKNYYEELKQIIEYHMDKYYNLDEPEISDYEYDMLMKELKEIEKNNPSWVTPDSPTQKVGGKTKRTAGEKVEHNVPMLSIEDVFTKEEVIEWVKKVLAIRPDAKFSVEFKIDGLSLTLRYENGMLTLAETRGTGYIGENVTLNALAIPDVKKTIDAIIPYLEIRGEVYMTHENFDKYNETQERLGKKLAANPRNLAAGSLRQLDANITKERGLNMFIFNIQDGPIEYMENHMVGLDKLEELGIKTVKRFLCSTVEEVLAAIDEIDKLRETLPYDIDGAVVKIVQTSYRDDFSSSSKYSTGHIAYKYPPQIKETEILEILEDVGRTGKITTRARFKPIRLGGSTVQYVTLHNQDYINEKGIGVGAFVNVFKSGEIIPKIEKVTKAPKEIFKISSICPICGEPTFRDENAADIYCVNPSCPAQLVRTISNFTSTNCMNIMGLGETFVESLINEGYLKDYSDIYRLKDHKDVLIHKGILGKEKNTTKLLANIEKSKENSAIRLLTSLGIRNVGVGTAKDIMSNFSSIEELSNASVDVLKNIPNVGEITAQCIFDFFNNEHNKRILQDLISFGVNTKMEEKVMLSNCFEGLTFVVTGTLPTMGRKEVSDLIEKNGGKVSGSVSKKTSYVVVGEDAGSKYDKAKELGISILSESDLLNMLK